MYILWLPFSLSHLPKYVFQFVVGFLFVSPISSTQVIHEKSLIIIYPRIMCFKQP